MKVFTNINTLAKVKSLFSQIGISFLLDGSESYGDSVIKILDELIDRGKAVEFLRIITRDDDTDFAEMESSEVGKIVSDFFTGTTQFFPDWMISLVKTTVSAELAKPSKISTSTISTPSKG